VREPFPQRCLRVDRLYGKVADADDVRIVQSAQNGDLPQSGERALIVFDDLQQRLAGPNKIKSDGVRPPASPAAPGTRQR
jgi:hypothetical protein